MGRRDTGVRPGSTTSRHRGVVGRSPSVPSRHWSTPPGVVEHLHRVVARVPLVVGPAPAPPVETPAHARRWVLCEPDRRRGSARPAVGDRPRRDDPRRPGVRPRVRADRPLPRAGESRRSGHPGVQRDPPERQHEANRQTRDGRRTRSDDVPRGGRRRRVGVADRLAPPG